MWLGAGIAILLRLVDSHAVPTQGTAAGEPRAIINPQSRAAVRADPDGDGARVDLHRTTRVRRHAFASRKDRAAAPTLRLGVVRFDDTCVYRSATDRSRVLFRCVRGTALGLVGQTRDYYAVMMLDRSLGFVKKSCVELRDQVVRVGPGEAQTTHRIVRVALEYLGTHRGASAFVRSVFARVGTGLPRRIRDQFRVGASVPWGELAPGDRLFFCRKGTTPDHTGIYIGGGQFVHASPAVVVSSISEPRFFRTLVGARRGGEAIAAARRTRKGPRGRRDPQGDRVPRGEAILRPYEAQPRATP